MTQVYCPKCGKKGSLVSDERELENGEAVRYWKVGHNGTENRTYCYLGREEREVTKIGEEEIETITIGDKENKDEILEVNAKEPFTAEDPMKGMLAWGPADVEKEIINEYRDENGYKIVTVTFGDGSENKVRLLENRKEDES